ncbi:glycosyltransferase family 9 protein [Pseudoxanthomonas sp. PXM02]|uniref:glycosyltransferase family 9 protein n=1 Tax=Pseudoxanthomonas sp. PXM02 TaxID=2769294 RepID=UPI001782619A|nr:glycosyltransferase family 9 protein [Pseudoxanthomonas sp. PXM02]MBD9480206.1 glycosyltransferase family 9 protein [Pseudoxanthomonas sp. PXM02]
MSGNAPPLVVRCGAFGDVVMLTTMIRLLHARYGQRVDVLGSGGWTPPLLTPLPEVGHVQIVSSRNTPYLLCPSQWAAVRWLRGRGNGPVYVCDTDAATLQLLSRAGLNADDIVQRTREDDESDGVTRLWPDRWLRIGMRDPSSGYPTHAVEPSIYRFPQLQITEADRDDLAAWRAATQLEGQCVLFQPGNKRTHKRGNVGTASHPKYWPPQAWADVATAIWQHLPQARIVLCGSPAEHGVLDEISAATGNDPRLYNAARELPVPRLLALLEQAHSLVSVDTGPAHAAAALGCPLVVMFGAASPAKWRPIGPGAITVLGGERGEASRVRDIPAEDVIAAWTALPARGTG